MHSKSDGVHGTPNVVLGSEGPSPTQEATSPNEDAGPRVNTKGPGQGRASGSGQPMPKPRPIRAKKNLQPAKVVLDNTIQRRSSKQVEIDKAKAKADAIAAEAAAITHKQNQLNRVASLEDAMQAREDAEALEAIRPDLHISHKSALNTDTETLSDSHLMLDDPIEIQRDLLTDLPLEQYSYHDSSYSEEFLSGWEAVGENATVGEENNKDRDFMRSEAESEADENQTQPRKKPAPTPKAKFKPQRGHFRAAVTDARQVHPPTSQVKKRKGPEPPPSVDGNTSTKRTKMSEAGGLLHNWEHNVPAPSQIAKKHPIEFFDDDNDFVEGEFDRSEGPETLNAVRASKPSTVRKDLVLISTKITPRIDYKMPNRGRPKQKKFVVEDLPFPHPRMGYNVKWQKEFRPTLISWASTFEDPYATNTALDDMVVMEIWDMIYPEINLIDVDRRETTQKLLYLAGNILHDWRSAIGSGALNIVRNHFLLPANHFHKERIIKFVRWGLDPKKFNFIYGAPNAEANQKQGFRSELILNVYGIHLRKVAGAFAEYGEHTGALALCTAATERALSFWTSGEDMSMKVDDNGRPKLSASFGEIEWGPKARGWSQSTSRLSAEQWRIITAEATARSNKLAQGDPNGEDNGEVDPRGMLEL